MNRKTTSLILKLVAFVTLFIHLFISFAATAVTEFKIITLQHRFAEDILPTIQTLLTDNGTATAMQNHLIVRTSARNMAEIEQAIAKLDVIKQNLKITVRRNFNMDSTASNTNISARKRIGDVEITTGNHPKARIDGAHIQIESSQSQVRNNSDQSINTMDGEQAFILVGQSIPYTQEWITLTNRYVSRQRTTEYVEINTGFAVRPRSIGNQIELEITPRFTQLNQNQHIDFETLSTTIRLTRGEWLDLSNLMLTKDEISRAILSWENGSQSKNNHVSVRID